jgi:hypothetical protein
MPKKSARRGTRTQMGKNCLLQRMLAYGRLNRTR